MSDPLAVLYVGDTGRAAALDGEGFDVETVGTAGGDRTEGYDCVVYEGDAEPALVVAIRDERPDVPVFEASGPDGSAVSVERLAGRIEATAANATDQTPAAGRGRDRERLAALFENIGDPVVRTEFVDGEPMARAVNPAFERVFGYDAEEIIGAPLNEFVVPEDERESARRVDGKAVSNERVQAEVRRRTADGIRYFLFRGVPIAPDDPSGNYEGFGIYTDITDRKTRERRLEVLNRVFRHNMRNDMNVIGGYADLIGPDADPEQIERAAAAIRDTAAEVTALSAKIRDVQRTLDRTGDGQRVPAGDLFERVVEPYDVDADVVTDVPPDLCFEGSEGLELAFRNLVDNAVVHNDRDVPSVRIAAEREGDWITVAVRDDGPGIPAAERAMLTGDREITQLEHGSGLGLWIVNWVVTTSGGEVAFADNEPRGSVVTVRLPAA